MNLYSHKSWSWLPFGPALFTVAKSGPTLSKWMNTQTCASSPFLSNKRANLWHRPQHGRLRQPHSVSAGGTYLRRLHPTWCHLCDIHKTDGLLRMETDPLLMGEETATRESPGLVGWYSDFVGNYINFYRSKNKISQEKIHLFCNNFKIWECWVYHV